MRGYAVFNIKRARNICDREGNGRFVYFEPKKPSAGPPPKDIATQSRNR